MKWIIKVPHSPMIKIVVIHCSHAQAIGLEWVHLVSEKSEIRKTDDKFL